MSARKRSLLRAAGCAWILAVALAAPGLAGPYPILFVTQVPIPGDFTAVASVFGNHQPDMESTGRGGDLWILYPNGTLRNLTQLAGYGVASGFQGATAIGVREPAVDWTGTKALFSMVVGAPTQRYEVATYFWQLYEVTGLGPTDTPVITRIANQPANANNVSPAYLSDGRILFTSDRPRGGGAYLYPQLDEYEEAPTVSGLWALDRTSGRLELLDHAPSGDFKPTVDSFGRVIFTRWDHLQRDQQADTDALDPNDDPYGTFNWSAEAPGAVPLATRAEVFPEPRTSRPDLLQPYEEGHSFNHFFPWMMNQDGSEQETLNHVGRHDLHSYFNRSFNDDGNLDEFICGGNACGRVNPVSINNLLQIRESPTVAGRYYGVDAPEFYTHAAGEVVWLPGEPTRAPDDMPVTEITHPSTASFTQPPAAPAQCHSGLYREPLPLSDSTLVVVHAGEVSPGVPETRLDAQTGSRAAPGSRYKFRLRDLVPTVAPCAGFQKYGATLTPGITKTLWFWDPDVRVDYTNVTLWELDPVEVRPHAVPPSTVGTVPAIEASVFAAEQVDLARFQQRLADNDLSLIVSRNVTTRDGDDRQQPFNLAVTGGASTIGVPGRVYDVEYLQLFQGDQIRGLGGTASPRQGKRVLAQVMHDPRAKNPPPGAGAPAGSTKIGLDGSMAAMVPAHRAMAWQLTDGTGKPVVRERYWLTFKPGEVRVCASCHGISSRGQDGQLPPVNSPEALRHLLQWWKATEVFRSGFELGSTAAWGAAAP
ncbi:MAG TPA: hypothetical protein VGV61_19380 [Thermoanaerobaculia bacterium]|jgi:hypothetical protein|nr:hypothetical protein [Thermoanaerobaculia bacterium]